MRASLHVIPVNGRPSRPTGSFGGVDTRLVQGFRFSCQPQCGLCCYTSPRIRPVEIRLLQAQNVPVTVIGKSSRGGWIPARRAGGACECLRRSRCQIYAYRPRPCRQYPLNLFVGDRAQALLNLSCPGINLAPLHQAWSRAQIPPAPPRGLEAEFQVLWDRWEEFRTRGRRRGGGKPGGPRFRHGALNGLRRDVVDWVRCRVHQNLPEMSDADWPPEGPPPASERLENLPLFRDPGRGVGGLRSGPRGWEGVLFRESGGIRGLLNPSKLPSYPPALSTGADRLLQGYLHYLVERDHTLWLLANEGFGGDGTTFANALRELLGVVTTEIVGRGWFLAKSGAGSRDPLGMETVATGIRAVDSDLLDIPTRGLLL
jgi:Fe-S-cluster containining protein